MPAIYGPKAAIHASSEPRLILEPAVRASRSNCFLKTLLISISYVRFVPRKRDWSDWNGLNVTAARDVALTLPRSFF